MGCGSSKQVGDDEPFDEPTDDMRPGVRREFFRTIDRSLRDTSYVIIGGSALAEYGSARATMDVDVLVGEGTSKQSAEDLLIQRSQGRIQRLGHGKIGYFASDGRQYQLDLSQDVDVDLAFDRRTDTRTVSGVKLGTPEFLLNSKAHAWQTRVPYTDDYQKKRQNDARDIQFILTQLAGARIPPQRLNWVYTRQFWEPFLQTYPNMRRDFARAGIDDFEGNTVASSPGGSLSGRSNLSSMSSFHSQPDRNSGRGRHSSSSQQGRYSNDERSRERGRREHSNDGRNGSRASSSRR